MTQNDYAVNSFYFLEISLSQSMHIIVCKSNWIEWNEEYLHPRQILYRLCLEIKSQIVPVIYTLLHITWSRSQEVRKDITRSNTMSIFVLTHQRPFCSYDDICCGLCNKRIIILEPIVSIDPFSLTSANVLFGVNMKITSGSIYFTEIR